MMGNTFGRLFRVTTCGESYAGCFRKRPEIPKELYGGLMAIIDGVPAGIKITAEDIQSDWTSASRGRRRWIPRASKRPVYIFPA